MIVFANVMIPSIAGHIIVMLVLLVPIAIIEAVVLAYRHSLNFLVALGLSFRANLRSTLVGLPVGYAFALLGLIPAGLFSSLMPENIKSFVGRIYIHAIGLGGTIPSELDDFSFCLGTLLVMIPYFLVTIRVERNCIAKLRPDLDDARLTTTVRLMNDLTYGLLMIPIVTAAIVMLIRRASGGGQSG